MSTWMPWRYKPFFASMFLLAFCYPLVGSSDGKSSGVYEVRLPDYHRISNGEWKNDRNQAWLQLNAIAAELLTVVKDEALPIDKRVDALSLVKSLGAIFVVRGLIDVIDLVDERGVIYADPYYGKYPVVSVLADYGRPMLEPVISRAIREGNAERRRLLCEVLVRGVGAEMAGRELSKVPPQVDGNSPSPRFIEEVRREIARHAQKDRQGGRWLD